MAIFLDPVLEGELLASILQKNQDVLNSGLQKYLDESFFSIDSYGWLAKYLKSKEIPSREFLRIELEEQFKGDELDRYKQSLFVLYEKQLSFVNGAIDKFRDYIAFQIAKSRITYAFESRNRTKSSYFWIQDMREGINEAWAVWEREKIESIDYAGTFAEREKGRKERRDNPELFSKLRLGIEDFDSQISMVKGTVTNFLAPFKRYKSVVLNAIGFAALLQGFNVVHIVFENTIELTTNRYDSMFTGVNYDRMSHYLKTTEERDRVNDLMGKVDGWPNRLKILKATPYVTTINDVTQVLDQWEKEEGFIADVTIWDYLNLVFPSKTSSEERLRNEQVVWDLQNHAKMRGKERITVTASQAKVEALDVDRLDSTHQGKSIGISQALDATISINQTKEERRDGIIVLSPLYIRDGAILKDEIVLRADLSRMCISREMEDLWKEVEYL